MASLTHGAVRRLVVSEGQQSDPSFSPTVQVINVRRVGKGGADRFRTILSDGENFIQGMLATQLNHMVEDRQIADNTIVKIRDFMVNPVQNKMVVILLSVDIVNVDYGSKIGNPTEVNPEQARQQARIGAGGGGAPPPMYGNAPQQSRPPQQQQNQYGSGGRVKAESPYSSGGGSNPYGGGNRYGSSSNNAAGSSSAPIARQQVASNGQQITPIANLNLYMNRWTIRARVTSKGGIRTWSNAKGEGCLFSTELLDSSGTDIRATFFKEAVDKFYNMVEVDKVYTFSGGRLKVANMQYNTCKSQCEINFDANAEIHLEDDTGDIQGQLYDFKPIADLEAVEPGQNVDVACVVKSVGEVGHITSKKTGKELTKCELTLADDSNTEVTLTVWGDEASKAAQTFGGNPIVAFRRARVSDFGGRSLSTSMNGSTVINPRIPESDRLRNWWQREGQSGASASRSLSSAGGRNRVIPFEERKPIDAIKSENMGHNPDKPEYLSFKGTFTFLKKDREGGAWYCACSNAGEPCKNRYKVQQTPDGHWQCERCGTTSPTCVRRWIFSATVADETSTTWVSVFNEQAESMFDNRTADDVYNRTMNPDAGMDEDQYNAVFDKANFTDWIFNCKVKQELVGDETRVKASVSSVAPVDYVKESRNLIASIAKMA
eukprot:CAMPEP_0113582910 /NCGR_PEP_ID=MMETSP0015_2-20120614/32195_1 /TAXON_ID=2838 /ORGANISM="Odontella" /LENGTH=659 /DNA_ID=CAMNT_0000487671 /DNA_START=108 /DNA_END=2087 /DNA_ORIENTATION=- /assembly_acc=CAM_ASM_000160